MFRLLVLVVCLGMSQALTENELAAFSNDGTCGGFVSVDESGSDYLVVSTGFPDHQWQCTNPCGLGEQNLAFSVPQEPSTTESWCVDQDEIGISRNGVPIFGPLTGARANAVEGSTMETMDLCGGHANPDSEYHYHELPQATSECNKPVWDSSSAEAQFWGIAMDGHPIYSGGMLDGVNLGDDVDECNGRTLPDGRYAYVAVTRVFPYVLGCYRSEPANDITTYACPAGGEAGQLCQCEGGAAVWLTYGDVTHNSRTRRSPQSNFTPNSRTRRSPQSNFNSTKTARMRRNTDGAITDCNVEPQLDGFIFNASGNSGPFGMCTDPNGPSPDGPPGGGGPPDGPPDDMSGSPPDDMSPPESGNATESDTSSGSSSGYYPSSVVLSLTFIVNLLIYNN